MKRSLHIDLAPHFGGAVPAHRLGTLVPTLAIRHADRSYYRSGADSAIVQEFDGRYGYLYSYELCMAAAVHIPVRVAMGDLHALYLMEGSGDIVLLDANGQPLADLAPKRARYLYLPPNDYILYVPQGSTHLFGFYFDGGIFRTGSERAYRFLQPALTAYREHSPRPAHSIDFEVGPRTRLHIEHLCGNLRKSDLNNEVFVIEAIHKLILLSKDKIAQTYNRMDPETLILAGRKLLEEAVTLHGNKALIKDVASRLRVSPTYLSRLHQRYCGQPFSTYRNALLVAQLKVWIGQHDQISYIAHISGFHGVSEMNRFFKRHTGTTPKQYKNPRK